MHVASRSLPTNQSQPYHTHTLLDLFFLSPQNCGVFTLFPQIQVQPVVSFDCHCYWCCRYPQFKSKVRKGRAGAWGHRDSRVALWRRQTLRAGISTQFYLRFITSINEFVHVQVNWNNNGLPGLVPVQHIATERGALLWRNPALR